MINTFIHTSENNNLYLYNHQLRLSMLMHPEFKKVWEKSETEDSFYLKKYNYLKKHGFFSNSKPTKFANIDESAVKDLISQTPQIVFETTDFCNLDCLYCSFGEFYEGYDERHQKNINTIHAITLLEYIFSLKPKDKNNILSIGFYGGEPLCNGAFVKKIVEVISQLKSEKEITVEYNMTTNATLIHRYIDFLVENKFELLISLDGNENNHSYRVFKKNKKNSFKKVINNIDMIHRDYPEYFNRYVNFNAVLHDKNSVKEIFEFIYTRYHKVPRIAELASDDMNLDNVSVYNKLFHNKGESEAKFLVDNPNVLPHDETIVYSELIDFVKYYSINFYVSNIIDLLFGDKKYVPTNTCLPFWKKIMLTTTNKLMPCEKINYLKYSFGEVRNGKVIFDISEITSRYNFYYDHIKRNCESCYANKFCGVCLFLMDNMDKLGTTDFICKNFHDQQAFSNKG